MSETPVRRPRKIKGIAYQNVFETAVPTKSIARAFRALYTGTATGDQQKRAMEFIVLQICKIDEMEFRPESEGGYGATGVAAGKRFVGQQIRALLTASGQMIEALPD